MIELYDRYSQESRDLHESLVATGLSQLGVVIVADGFLRLMIFYQMKKY